MQTTLEDRYYAAIGQLAFISSMFASSNAKDMLLSDESLFGIYTICSDIKDTLNKAYDYIDFSKAK